MKEKIKENKKYIIIGITILIILSLGVTLAYYVWNTSSDEETKIVTSVGAATVYFDGGSTIDSTNIRPVESKEYGITKDISIKANTTGLTFNLYLDLTTLPDNLKEESFKYALYNGSTLITEGNFKNPSTSECNYNNTTHIVLLNNEEVSTSKVTYTLYIWIDGTVDNPSTMMNNNFLFNIHAEGTEAIILEGTIPDITTYPEELKGTLAYKIISDYYYADKTNVVSNNITYHYDSEHNLMADVGSNVRYYGSDPNNYIYFNCSDYTNQTSDTCELWRIIGVFDGKVKIMRNSSIGDYSWDTSESTVNDGYGENEWSTADLMKLLNPGYESESVGGSLYWNAGSGSCYSGYNNATTTCDFTSIGLKNMATRNLISESTWSIRGHNTIQVYADQIYEKERTTGSVYSGRPTSWTGYVALAYPSDYGYAVDLSLCKDEDGNAYMINDYRQDVCKNNNWMKSIFSGFSWLLTPNSGNSYSVWDVYSDGGANNYGNAAYTCAGAPVLYLNAEQTIESGNGSNNLPFQLLID